MLPQVTQEPETMPKLFSAMSMDVPIKLSEIGKQKLALKQNQKQKKSLKKTEFSRKLKNWQFNSSAPETQSTHLPRDSCHGMRRLSCSTPPSINSSQSSFLPRIRRSRSSANIASCEDASNFDNTQVAKLELALLQCHELHEQMLQETAESVEVTEYLQSELEMTGMKLHASMIEAHDLRMKLQQCTDKLNSTEQHLSSMQNLIRKWIERKEDDINNDDHDLRAVAKEILFSQEVVIKFTDPTKKKENFDAVELSSCAEFYSGDDSSEQ